MIITAAADEFAYELERAANDAIPFRTCKSAAEAIASYAGEKILFGNPSMIAEVLSEMPAVDWVQSTWAGVTPLIEHRRRDYVLTGVKGVFGQQMSEYVIGYLLAHELRILRRKASQLAHRWDDTFSGHLAGKRMGILGTGSIGAHIARTAACFGMTVLGCSRSGDAADGFDTVIPVERLDDFLENLDYLVSTLPDTPETDALLDSRSLGRLPDHAYFVNVGRSNVIVDDALVDSLREGALAGAALDVFDEEPVPENSPLWDAPNLSMTGHIAAISHPSLIVPIFVENYRRYRRGAALEFVVDFGAGY